MRRRRLVSLALTMVLFCLGPATFAAMECEAQVRSELIEEQPGLEDGSRGDRFVFRVEIRTEADCAKIRFELVAEVQTADGERETRRKPGRVRLSQGATDYRMQLDLEPGEELVEWSVGLTDCDDCTLFAPE